MTKYEKTLQQLLLAMDEVSDAIVIISPDDTTVQINKQFLRLFSGTEKNQLIEQPASKLVTHLTASLEAKNNFNARVLSRYIVSKFANKEVLQFEFKNDQGRYLRYQDQITEQGYRIGVFKDESSIIALHQQFENACNEAETLSHAKNSFMAAMSHEVKTPLNAIIGMLDLCILDDYIAENEYIKRIQKNADNLLSLINNVLDFAKFDANKVALSEVPTNLRELAESIIESFSASAILSKTELQLFVDPRIPDNILLDDLRITQVLNNLISNGLKFNSGKHPKLSLSINYDFGKQRITCLVTDNGIGISEKQQKYIFAGFEQASEDTHRRFGGSGLGLSICQRISWLMKGSLSVSSVIGKGTTFDFTFPLPENTLPCNIKNEKIASLIISTNDPTFFKSLTKYRPYLGFKTKFNAVPSLKLEENEFQFLSPSSKDISLKEIINSGSSERIRLLCNFDSTHFLNDESHQLKTISHIPLRLNELIQTLVLGEVDELSEAETAQKQEVPEAFFFDDVTALVVEDNPDNMFVFKRQLQKLSVSADFALDPNDAIIHFEQKHYDIVLSDYQMPGLSGAELVLKLRNIEQQEDRKQALMFVITADKTDLCQTECMAAGCDDLLMKPLTIAALSTLFERVIKDNDPGKNSSVSDNENSDTSIFNLDVLNEILGEVSQAELEEFLFDFEKNLNSAFKQISLAAESNNIAELGSLAHSLKSSALIIGAKPLSDSCNRLEHACQILDQSIIKDAWTETELSISNLNKALSSRAK